jgi:hypothetical protein
MSVDELIGRLKPSEERINRNAGKSIVSLNLAEDELVAQLSSHLKVSGNNGSDRSKEPSSSNNKHGHGCGRGHGSGIGHGGGVSSNDVATDECRYYSKKGHWARECRKKKQDKEVHVVQAEEEDEPTLFMASGTAVEPIAIQVQPGVVHLDESKLFVQLGENGGGDSARWIVDSGATNHMMGVQAVFSKINLRVMAPCVLEMD